MMANKCLFIGGHMDGRLEIVPDSLNIQERVVPQKFEPGVTRVPIVATERYYRYFVPGGKSMHQMMVLISIPQDRVLDLLMDRYHKTRGLTKDRP